MDNENPRGNRKLETPVHHPNDFRGNQTERFYKRHGLDFYYHDNNINREMAEIGKALLNTLGVTAFFLGIIANLNNWMAIALAVIGAAYTTAKMINEWDTAWPKVMGWIWKFKLMIKRKNNKK